MMYDLRDSLSGVAAMNELIGLRTLITGASSGIGLATAALMSDAGAEVAVIDIAPTNMSRVGYEKADLTDASAVRGAVTASVARLGGLDVLVNCAGIGARGGVEDNVDDEWRHVFT